MGALVTAPGVYDLVIEYQSNADPTITWSNTYTFTSTAIPTVASPIVQALAKFGYGMSWNDSTCINVKCYNWSRGTHPYPAGNPLFEVPQNTPCIGQNYWNVNHWPLRQPSGDEIVMRIDHAPSGGGKVGHNFFRNIFDRNDLSAGTVTKWVLIATIAALQAILNTLLGDSGLNAFFGNGSGGQALVIARYSHKLNLFQGTTPVTGFIMKGVTTNRKHRKNKK